MFRAFQRSTCLCLALAVGACASESDERTISVSGHAISFMPGNLRIEGVKISVLERPDLFDLTGAEGEFRIEGLAVGSEATFVLTGDDFHETQTRTFTLGDTDLERVTLHAPEHIAFSYLAVKLATDPDETRCQIASTVTVVGRSLYDSGHHGLAGATASIHPPVDPGQGPFYFDETTTPDLTLTETTEDGGVVFLNALPGRYTLRAHKEGSSFEDVEVTCRAGVLVNASPPYGLQAVE